MSTLYLWGKPIVSQSTPSEHSLPRNANLPTPLLTTSCGQNHCVLVTEDAVYGIGDNSQGQLGLQEIRNSGPSLRQIQIKLKSKVVGVSCGWYHTLLLDQSGKVFSSGKGQNGELGIGKTRSSRSFQLVLKGARQISAGKDHSLAICGHKVMGWGNSQDGQLGLRITKNYYTPQQLNVYPCSLIFAGEKYSIFVTSKGLYATGINSNYQLGLGHETCIQIPRHLDIQEEIVSLAGGKYCVVGTKNKEWYLWGSGVFGMLRFPTKMSFLNGAETVTVGQNFGLFMRIGKVYVWGCNDWGELGHHQTITDYAIESEQFTEMDLDGFVCSNHILLGYRNDESFRQQRYNRSRINIDKENSIEYGWRNIDDVDNSCQNQHNNSFSRQYQTHYQDTILQDNKGYYTLKNREYLGTTAQQSSSQEGWPLQQANRFQAKKYVKLINPYKTLPGDMMANLKKQNQELRERLEFQKYQKEKMQKQHMRTMNNYGDRKVSEQMNKVCSLVSSINKQIPLTSHHRSPNQKQILGSMGTKIESLKSQLSDLCQ